MNFGSGYKSFFVLLLLLQASFQRGADGDKSQAKVTVRRKQQFYAEFRYREKLFRAAAAAAAALPVSTNMQHELGSPSRDFPFPYSRDSRPFFIPVFPGIGHGNPGKFGPYIELKLFSTEGQFSLFQNADMSI